jgi:hypothetical protein
MAAKLDAVLASPPDKAMRQRAKQACDERFAFARYVRELSVVVPNFNYAHCLRDRLNTIFDQTREERRLFESFVNCSQRYLEFGVGGSTWLQRVPAGLNRDSQGVEDARV